jgi:hypothetical protein
MISAALPKWNQHMPSRRRHMPAVLAIATHGPAKYKFQQPAKSVQRGWPSLVCGKPKQASSLVAICWQVAAPIPGRKTQDWFARPCRPGLRPLGKGEPPRGHPSAGRHGRVHRIPRDCFARVRIPDLRQACTDARLRGHPSAGRHGPPHRNSRDCSGRQRTPDQPRARTGVRLAVIFRKAATALRIEIPEIVLADSGPLIGRELVEPNGLTVVLREAAAALLVEEPEMGLPPWVSLAGSELEETRGFAIVLGDPPAAILVEAPEASLPSCVSLICRELVETGRLAVVSRQAAAAA